MTILKLRAAMYKDPCKRHKDECPIPPKKVKRPCQWGHCAMEFAEHCDDCAKIVLAAMKNPYNFGQRLHHMKSR